MKVLFEAVNDFFGSIVGFSDLLWDFPKNLKWYANIPILGQIPFAIFLLIGMGIYFTIRTRGVQFRFFKHGLHALLDKKNGDVGVSQLASFMLSTAERVGPGNIMGVTGAISIGGPGAVFWMWIAALFGMASSFIEATLAQIFKGNCNQYFLYPLCSALCSNSDFPCFHGKWLRSFSDCRHNRRQGICTLLHHRSDTDHWYRGNNLRWHQTCYQCYRQNGSGNGCHLWSHYSFAFDYQYWGVPNIYRFRCRRCF